MKALTTLAGIMLIYVLMMPAGSITMKNNQTPSGIVFFRCRDLDTIQAFYVQKIGCSVWLDQGGCIILQAGNMLFGFCRSEEPEIQGVITFFYPSAEAVDKMYQRLKSIAREAPKTNQRYRIYHFYAADPEGRSIEFQHFLHPLKKIL